MPGGWRLAVAGITAGIAVSVVIYMRRRSRRTLLPVTCTDKKGTSVIVRIATLDDRPQVASHIADQTGTGSGVGNDDYLLQEFERMVGDPTTTMLFVEDEAGTGLGMMCVVWSSPTESYWQSLRVSQSARGRGIAQLLFNIAAKLALERQGPHSVSRWGVVSSNEIMTTWSKRLGLEGPQLFRRHGAKATATPPTLPPGYVLRPATVADVPLIMRRMAEFPVASSSFSSQNFVASGWADFSEATLRACISNETCRGTEMPTPQLLFDERGELVSFATLAILKFGPTRFMMHRYMDGEAAAVELMLHALPSIAHDNKCDIIGGYVPTLPWLIDIFERSSVYTRATATEQHEFHWHNAKYASSQSR